VKRISLASSSLCFLICASVIWAGCGQSQDEDTATAEGAATVCPVVDMGTSGSTGKKTNLTATAVGKLRDPVAKFIFQTGKTCPSNFTEIQAKLRETDSQNCAETDIDRRNLGVTTRFVSDRAQVLGTSDTMRAVVTRECGGRSDHEFFISAFGIPGNPTENDVPKDVELIGEERDAKGNPTGVFNYYARENGEWRFFGSSKDYVTSGYNCNDDGACTPKAAQNQRCAGCHPGGGLNMKELNAPWVHWEGDTNTPGVADMFSVVPAVQAKLDAVLNKGVTDENKKRTMTGFEDRTTLQALKDFLVDGTRVTRQLRVREGNNFADRVPTDAEKKAFSEAVAAPEVVALDKRVSAFNAVYGTQGNGIDLEGKVVSGNDEWNRARVGALKAKGVAELLRPLFCTLDINIQTSSVQTIGNANGGGNGGINPFPGGGFIPKPTPGGPVIVPAATAITQDIFVGTDFFLDDRMFNAFASVRLPAKEYSSFISDPKNGHIVADGRGRQLEGKFGKVSDTFFGFAYIEQGQITQGYVQELQTQKIVDNDFVKDVAAIDFTRPIFSKTRCDLLQFAPTLEGKDINPDKIRDGFVKNLEGKTEPAAKELLGFLKDKKDGEAHDQTATKFVEACGQRSQAKEANERAAFVNDVVTWASHLRKASQRHRAVIKNNDSTQQLGSGIIEFAETMPKDSIPETKKSWDPKTCQLK
jgi:hypothetical protein